jgi:hypothetical protein
VRIDRLGLDAAPAVLEAVLSSLRELGEKASDLALST